MPSSAIDSDISLDRKSTLEPAVLGGSRLHEQPNPPGASVITELRYEVDFTKGVHRIKQCLFWGIHEWVKIRIFGT